MRDRSHAAERIVTGWIFIKRRRDVLFQVMEVLIPCIFLAFSSVFHQCFYTPKLLSIYALALSCVLALTLREEIILPSKKISIFLASYAALIVMSGLIAPAPRYGLIQILFLFSAITLYIAMLNLTDDQRQLVLDSVYYTAAAESTLIIFQFMIRGRAILPGPLLQEPARLSGTIGNPEFAATLLGVSFIIGLNKLQRQRKNTHKAAVFASLFLMAAGILLTRSKGTFIFLGAYLIWRYHRNPKTLMAAAIFGLALIAKFFPVSILGRLFLWIIALKMFRSHFWKGVGLTQFENNYLSTVHNLFANNPALLIPFGGFTSLTLDAHNIILQNAAELGIAGLILSAIFVRYATKLVISRNNPLTAALAMLLCKSLYTVVLNSPTSMLLLAVVFGSLSSGEKSLRWKPRSWKSVVPLTAVATAAFLLGSIFCLSDYWYQKGLVNEFIGNTGTAANYFKKSIQINSENSNSCLGLAYANFLEGNRTKMSFYIHRAIHYRRDMDTYKISAHMYYYSGLYPQAAILYQYILSVFPQHLTSMAKLALIFQATHRNRAAIAMARRILATRSRRKNASDFGNIETARRILREYGAI